MKKLINWSELSRYITGGDRNTIRSGKISRKHIEALRILFVDDLPKWWAEQEKQLQKCNKTPPG